MGTRNQKGIALAIVLAYMLLLVLAVASIVLIGSSEIQSARRVNDSTRAFYIAEGGFQQAIYDLKQDSDWQDGSINGTTYNKADTDADGFYLLDYSASVKSSLNGEFTVRLKDIVGSTSEIWVKSKGIYNGTKRTIQAKVKFFKSAGSGNVDSAISAEGTVTVTGSAEVNPGGSIQENATLSFENLFGLTMSEMRVIAQNYNYYTNAFNNDTATGITWINAPSEESQITENGWVGDGILVVEGNLRVTGGTFSGVIWVNGEFEMAGNSTINGGIFVAGGASLDADITGNSEINYRYDDSGSDVIEDAFDQLSSLPPKITYWQEVAD